ncbi:hypothetical protein [Sphaerisporangium corydalis]|uniref:Uncharacterized protein n=1 Tax=Sphaerisporangium corydalis TaxID=1441875 RepID=A0ABV9EMI7_9ACTN|nr:hypothetical protein [Sphaerisporangium corydalis]
MTIRGSLASSAAVLAAFAVLAPSPWSAAGYAESGPVPDRPAIRSVKVRPGAPVAGPKGAVRLVVEVVARGASGPRGVTLRVEPGGRRRMRAPGGAAGGSGPDWEIWRFNPPVGLTRWYPAGRWRAVATARNARGARATATATFLFRKATTFSRVRVTRAKRRAHAVRVTGTLMRVDPTGRFDYWTFPRQRVTLQFRKHAKGRWKKVATTRTNGDGDFARRVRRARGTWRVVYPGTRHYADVSTSARHITRN